MPHQTTNDAVQTADALAQVYARSLFDLAEQDNQLDEVADELNQLVDLLDSQPDLDQLFALQSIHPTRRAASIEAIFSGQVSTLFYNFLQVLNAKGRLNHLRAIRVGFSQRLGDKYGEMDVELYSAKPLEPAMLTRIGDRLTTVLGRKAVLHNRVDESMIGGLKLRIGDKLLDGSVAMQLQQIKRKLMEAGREKAREDLAGLIEE